MPEPHRHHISWQQLRHDLARPAKGQIAVALILCLFSMVLVTQVRHRSAQDEYAAMSRSDLITVLDRLSTSSRQLDSEIADLRETKRQLQSGADSHKIAEKQAVEEQHRLQVMSGTTPVSGPGVTITIHDPRDKVTSDLLLNAVEELRDAGAEAIAVNSDIRVVANTWFGRDANGLVISGKKVRRPMTLTVLGEPHALTEGAKFRGGLVSQVESAQVGGSVSITPSDSLTISAVVKPTPMSFATPVR